MQTSAATSTRGLPRSLAGSAVAGVDRECLLVTAVCLVRPLRTCSIRSSESPATFAFFLAVCLLSAHLARARCSTQSTTPQRTLDFGQFCDFYRFIVGTFRITLLVCLTYVVRIFASPVCLGFIIVSPSTCCTTYFKVSKYKF